MLPETFWNEHVVMFLAGWRHLRRRRSVTDQHQRLLESGISSALALFETFPHRLMEPLRARFFWLAGRGTLHLWYGNADQHQRVRESRWAGELGC